LSSSFSPTGFSLARSVAVFGWPGGRGSPEKLYDTFNNHFRRCSSLTEFLTSFRPDPRHISKDKRLSIDPNERIGYSLG